MRRLATRVDRASPHSIRAALNMTSDLVLFVEPGSLRLLDVNESACGSLDYGRAELLKMTLPELVPLDDRESLESGIDRVTARRRARIACRNRFRRRDGALLPVETTIRKLPSSERRHVIVVVGQDVTDRQQLEYLLAAPGQLDPLTHLPNRAVLENRLRAAAAHARQHDDRFGVLLIDVDHFKKINDERGHLVGDAVLKTIAERLARCFHADDVVSRFGGDEFVVLAARLAGKRQVARLANRILTSIALPIPVFSDSVRVSASIGIAIADGRPASANRLLADADRGMYAAKSLGRDGRFVIVGHQSAG